MRHSKARWSSLGLLGFVLGAGCASGAPRSAPVREVGRPPLERLVTIAVVSDPSLAQEVEDRLVRAFDPEIATASHEVVAASLREDVRELRERYLELGFDGVLMVSQVALPATYVDPGGWSQPIFFSGGGDPEYATYSLPRAMPTTVPGVRFELYDLGEDRPVWRSERQVGPASRLGRGFTEGFAAGVAHELRKAGVVAVSPRRSDPSPVP